VPSGRQVLAGLPGGRAGFFLCGTTNLGSFRSLGNSPNELRDHLARRVRLALLACVARLRKDKEPVDETSLNSEVDAVIGQFVMIGYGR
jgi:hypothetical protein